MAPSKQAISGTHVKNPNPTILVLRQGTALNGASDGDADDMMQTGNGCKFSVIHPFVPHPRRFSAFRRGGFLQDWQVGVPETAEARGVAAYQCDSLWVGEMRKKDDAPGYSPLDLSRF